MTRTEESTHLVNQEMMNKYNNLSDDEKFEEYCIIKMTLSDLCKGDNEHLKHYSKFYRAVRSYFENVLGVCQSLFGEIYIIEDEYEYFWDDGTPCSVLDYYYDQLSQEEWRRKYFPYSC